ncbi:MAG: SAVED domain-containing protein [Burkholderiales bacterium]|nr:SAVED domain-containing protein [Burkholderiales bacterium]
MPTSTAPSCPHVLAAHGESELLNKLKSPSTVKSGICYVHGKRLFAVFMDDGSADELFFSDLDNDGFKELTSLAKKGKLKRHEMVDAELVTLKAYNSSWPLRDASEHDVKALKEAREATFGKGRGKAISAGTSLKVWADAGGRCMYAGCGEDLSHVPLSTAKGQVAYLAHIVASDPDGPRGGARSHELSDVPENIMLMCDAHHRLIDRIDADSERHEEQSLNTMRAAHVKQVNYLLNSLKYPRAKMMTVLADLAAVPVNQSENDLSAASIGRKLVPVDPAQHEIRRRQRDTRTEPDFWCHLLHEHELDISHFRRNIADAIREHAVAIYPLHLVPVLVLAGRIAGEAGRVEVFQYHRERDSWQWDAGAIPYPADSLRLETHSQGCDDEVVLSLELTSDVDEAALPLDLSDRIAQGRLSWIRLRHAKPSTAAIRHPDDLQHFRDMARKAVALVQDQLRARKVHLIAPSPASALFCFGQMLQPGHHPPYVVYDRPNGSTRFNPGLCIEGDKVTATNANAPHQTQTLQLR